MPEWLQGAVVASEPLPSAEVLTLRLTIAVMLGFVVAAVYSLSLGRRRGDTRTLPTTLVLLSVLIALVTLVIGNSVARAFGLVGALSIVRFRTVVEDTRDTAFVIFAVVVGMAVGAGAVLLALIGIPLVGGAAFLMSRIDRPRGTGDEVSAAVTVRVGLGFDLESTLASTFRQHVESFRLVGVSTARQGAAIDVTYELRLPRVEQITTLIRDLNQTEGVQNVELRRG